MQEALSALLDGDRGALSKAITLVESSNEKDRAMAAHMLSLCLGYPGNSIRIGITGIPGVGKSTFIEAFGSHLTSIGKKVAVLAVDPSSPVGRGSILGDKTRMTCLANDDNAFIRPTPSGNKTGGVAESTRASMALIEAAGYDVIIVETVGTGQSETAVRSMVDFFILLMQTGTGDGLQAIKKGVIELADAVVFNKADGHAIKATGRASAEMQQILSVLSASGRDWKPQSIACSALEKKGMEKCWALVEEFHRQALESGSFERNRRAQDVRWMKRIVTRQLEADFYAHPAVKRQAHILEEAVAKGKISPMEAAEELLRNYRI